MSDYEAAGLKTLDALVLMHVSGNLRISQILHNTAKYCNTLGGYEKIPKMTQKVWVYYAVYYEYCNILHIAEEYDCEYKTAMGVTGTAYLEIRLDCTSFPVEAKHLEWYCQNQSSKACQRPWWARNTCDLFVQRECWSGGLFRVWHDPRSLWHLFHCVSENPVNSENCSNFRAPHYYTQYQAKPYISTFLV